MALSDEIRKIQNPETNYDNLAQRWEWELEKVAASSGYDYYLDDSDGKYHYRYRRNAVAGPIGLSLDYERRVTEVKVQGYNQRDLKRYNKLTNYNPGFIWRGWPGRVDDNTEYIPLENMWLLCFPRKKKQRK